MSFLLWHRERSVGIAATRSVLRANEVPLFVEANELCERIEALRDEKTRYVAAAGEEARRAGLAEGREAGLRAARDELAAKLAEFAQAAAREREQLRANVAALALQVVRKIAGQIAPEATLAALAEAAARDMLPSQTMTLFVHPDHCEAVRERLAAMMQSAPHGDHASVRLDVQPDALCAPDTCRIETEHGAVDASLETQLARLAAAWGVATA